MVKRIDWTPELLAKLPTTKENAISIGSRHYFPNIECKRGHISCWIVGQGCFLCIRERIRRQAEKRRRRLGMKTQKKANIPSFGTRHENLVSTGQTKRVYNHKSKRNELRLKVKCDCGILFWIRADGLFKQKKCKSCSQRLNSISHGLLTGVNSDHNIVEKNVLTYTLYASAKRRAKRSGIEFELEPADIEYIAECPVFGIQLDWSIRQETGNRKPRDNAPSIDRLDSSQGYTKENSVVVSYKANVLKKAGTAHEHELVADWLDEVNHG